MPLQFSFRNLGGGGGHVLTTRPSSKSHVKPYVLPTTYKNDKNI
ncbi:hypothetical protein E2C01_058888 [Portunus trituberculatus]|uniref:Uncharacterized protein n=1 Tax=Portunus trituberculatus TaxID=210409 RepID=A0A5B7H5X6_PORTR|nr:hypothetical protein [Portunus trituberculatus]